MSDATFELDSLIKATAVGTVTMVAFYGEFPMESGNCFSVRSEDGKYRQVLNFGHENFEELLARKVISYPVEILPMSDGHCLMADHRIPKEWYNNEFCSSCTPNDLLPHNRSWSVCWTSRVDAERRPRSILETDQRAFLAQLSLHYPLEISMLLGRYPHR